MSLVGTRPILQDDGAVFSSSGVDIRREDRKRREEDTVARHSLTAFFNLELLPSMAVLRTPTSRFCSSIR